MLIILRGLVLWACRLKGASSAGWKLRPIGPRGGSGQGAHRSVSVLPEPEPPPGPFIPALRAWDEEEGADQSQDFKGRSASIRPVLSMFLLAAC